ncbi:fasciclin domain-containing protein [Nocardiopsis lambiniae]|uniref:Fasciclin domain-containing protein n=1 Tax=Nocardiopsis lambiniae TaxID=3075539 RepID=A0ABU2MJC0_9ACTN|nr:fasciclin domain-containing protein [Nocardiopsis sp. DSM 44743]MDT0331911.1 fasciclin domain-containing protein [Nocardiopsis sp. DSM 44743]
MIRKSILAGTAAFLALGLSACGSMAEETEPTEGAASEEATDQGMDDGGAEMTETAGENFGPGCASVPEDGSGSFEGMAQDPVATAASNNPLLSTLVTAVTEADLGDTLNSAEDITVFAPTNDAFAKIPEEDLEALLADKEQLTEVLTYHVVEGRQAPDALEDGTFASLQGGDVTTEGAGEEFTVNGDSEVVCGNVQTANATVYIVDTVLMPQ